MNNRMFAGKFAFASTGASVLYLTQFEFKGHGGVIRVPAMSGLSLGDPQRTIVYSRSDGSVRIQLPSLLWVTLHPVLGWLMLSETATDAVALKFSGNPNGDHWDALTQDGWKRVFYTLDKVSPILSVNGGDGFADTFAPTVITPSLQEIRQSRNGRAADLRFVDLTGENLDDIDFTGANFSAGTLNQATFTRATLVQSKFIGSSLNQIRCDGATLDRADMTRAKLDGTSWGNPARAPEIILTACTARDAVLGGQPTPLDCQ